jgi:hypothetical protein
MSMDGDEVVLSIIPISGAAPLLDARRRRR